MLVILDVLKSKIEKKNTHLYTNDSNRLIINIVKVYLYHSIFFVKLTKDNTFLSIPKSTLEVVGKHRDTI